MELLNLISKIVDISRSKIAPSAMMAVENNQWHILREFVKRGAYVGDHQYYEIIIPAAIKAGQSDIVIDLLKRKESDVFISLNCPGITPGAINDNLESGKALVHYAAQYGDFKLLQTLFYIGAYLFPYFANSLTPLEVAAEAGHWDFVAQVMTTYPDSIKKHSSRLTAVLSRAVQENQTEIASQLITLNIPVAEVSNYDSSSGNTAAHHIANPLNESLLNLLIEKQANFSTKNKKDETPVDILMNDDRWNLVEKIVKSFKQSKDFSQRTVYQTVLLRASSENQFS